MAQRIKNPTSIHEDSGLIPSPAQWVKDLVLLWLRCRPGTPAPIQPLAWKLAYVAGAALKRQKKNKVEPTNPAACFSRVELKGQLLPGSLFPGGSQCLVKRMLTRPVQREAQMGRDRGQQPPPTFQPVSSNPMRTGEAGGWRGPQTTAAS